MQQLLGIGVGLAISVSVSIVVPFPYSMGVMIPIFLAMGYFVRRQSLKKMRMLQPSVLVRNSVQFYCTNCGTEHNQRSCPKCGSTSTRIG
jgi:predicted RNA-binding Zn-ribbon protein involved in translation (DUF1610 family)